VADRHVDTLDVRRPFLEFTDEWVRAYVNAGGKTPYVKA
jgi:hypothetical protein